MRASGGSGESTRCDRYEDDGSGRRRDRGRPPRRHVPSSRRAALLVELLKLDRELRQARGDPPTISEYLDRFPGYAPSSARLRRPAGRQLRPDRPGRRGGHGRRLPRLSSRVEPRRRAEDDPAVSPRRLDGRRSLPAGIANRRAAGTRAHRPGLRGRPGGRPALLHDALHRGPESGRGHRPQADPRPPRGTIPRAGRPRRRLRPHGGTSSIAT